LIVRPIHTGGACLLDGEETLLHAHLALATAGRADIEFAAFRTVAVASFALTQRRQADFLFHAAHSLLKIQLQRVAQVLTASGTLLLSAATAAENVPENITENVVDIAKAGPAPAPPPMPLTPA
jgi:hypothetical protein